MTIDEAEDRQHPRRRRRRGLAIGVGLVSLGIAALWLERTPIATQVIDRELARRGVPAHYSIVRLGFGGATLAGLSIGDPAAPDLTASRVTVGIGWGMTGARISGVDLDGVRMRGKFDDKGLSFGALDRLRPTPSGKPFALPDLDVALRDARLQLTTPAGALGLAANGAGNLADGFAGRVALSAPRLQRDGCAMSAAKALFDVTTADRIITAAGPITVARADCAGVRAGGATADLSATVPQTLDSARGRIAMRARSVAHDSAGAALVAAQGGFVVAAPTSSAAFDGAIRWQGLYASRPLQDRIGRSAAGLSATPVGPLAGRATQALARAMRRSDGSTQIAVSANGKSGRISVSNLGARSASGAQLTTAGRVFRWSWPDSHMQLDGSMALSGGGLPDARLTVQPTGSNAWRILGSILPYAAADGARLALSPIRVDWNGDDGGVTTLANISGPFAGGAVRGLAVPVDVHFSRSGAISIEGREGCVDMRFAQLDIGGVRLGATRLPLCSRRGDTLFAIDGRGQLSGNVGAARIALNGSLNDAPLAVAAADIRLGVAGSSAAPRIDFALGQTSVRLKQPNGETSLKLAELTGATTRNGLEGRLSDANGAIAAVPLLVDQASGRWRYGAGELSLAAPSARVRDAVEPRRFEPVSARDIRLALKNGAITGDAVIAHPPNGKQLALVTLTHDLSAARGHAALTVPQLTFGDDLQPEALTPLTLGVIANVGGTIKGRGDIRWSSAGVSSDGSFETDGIGVSAAFGQVHGIKGRIIFDDLLGMTTPPGQIAIIGEMNPGVSVTNGIIRYQLLPNQHVKVEDGRWPFAGGALILEPTVLDFSKPSDRVFALTVAGLDAAQFMQQFDFKNLAVTGLFDGRLPLVFNEDGGRIVGGRLVSRQAGGTLAYVGDVSKADLGGPGKLAFDALKSMKYNALVIEMDGQLDGEIISNIMFNGSNDAPINPTGSAFPVQATGLPFKFNITVRAPFRALMSTAESFTDVRTTVRRALPAASDNTPGNDPVKPTESEGVR